MKHLNDLRILIEMHDGYEVEVKKLNEVANSLGDSKTVKVVTLVDEKQRDFSLSTGLVILMCDLTVKHLQDKMAQILDELSVHPDPVADPMIDE